MWTCDTCRVPNAADKPVCEACNWGERPPQQAPAAAPAPPPAATARACAHCGAEAVSQCINCKLVAYCSRKCQKRHWRDHHKGRCFSPSERAAFRTPATAAQLWHASWRGEEAAVLDLSMHGANVNHVNTKVGCNALFIAAQEGHDAVVRALLDAGADKEIARNDGTTALFIAAQVGLSLIHISEPTRPY